MSYRIFFLLPFWLLLHLQISYCIYIPPGPKYPCPQDSRLIYPCTCIRGGDTGLVVHCNRTNLATLSLGLNNARAPIDELLISHSRITRLYGPLFHNVEIRRLVIMDTPLTYLEDDVFLGVLNATLVMLNLTRTELLEIPEGLKKLSSLTVLRVDQSRLGNISSRAFTGLHLEDLRLINANISQLMPDAFTGLDKLKTLDLHGNQLKEIPKGIFQPLRNLEVLDVGHNFLAKLQPTYFSDLAKLINVNVSHNGLTEYPRGVFARNTVLRVINLSGNQIQKLDSNSFRGMRFLRRLYLNDNNISDIGRGTFGAISRIGTIDLARNLLQKIDFQMFHELNLCEHIDVSDNRITKIEKAAFKDIYLAKVNISYNQLEIVEAGAFVNCANMTLLDFSHNNLTGFSRTAFDSTTYPFEFRLDFNQITNLSHVPFDFMTGIAILNVSYNQLQVVPKRTFPKLYELHTVDFSHNQLTDIDGGTMSNLFTLRYLNLSHNNMSSLGGSAIGNMPTLIELNFSHNQVKDVARSAFTRLSSIRWLSLEHNFISNIFTVPISLLELNLANNRVSKIQANRIWPVMNSLLLLDLSNNEIGDNLESGSFANLISLQRLDLTNNSIRNIPYQALADLNTIQYIYLDFNNITELNRGAFGRLPIVFQLGLSHNNISQVSEKAFEGLLQLLHLNMSFNAISSIPTGAFHGLVSLRTLDLSHNTIERLENKTHSLLEDCLSLERINLTHNQISFISPKTFPESPWIPYRLSEIDLSFNRMPVLSKEILIGTKKVRQLNLRGNMLSEIRKGVLTNMTSLESLDLSHNGLTHLTKGLLGPLPNLTRLDLSHNLMVDIPIEEIVASARLKIINLRSNRLTRFYDEFMSLIENNSTEIFMEGNPIACDCRLRPLQFWLSGIDQRDDNPWSQTLCQEPHLLAGQTLASVDDESLTCGRNVDNKAKYAIVKDVVFREVTSLGSSITYSWYVQTRQDVGDFSIEVRPTLKEPHQLGQPDLVSSPVISKDVGYGIRSDEIDGIDRPSQYVVCIRARDSLGYLRPWKPNQCQPVISSHAAKVTMPNFTSFLVLAVAIHVLLGFAR